MVNTFWFKKIYFDNEKSTQNRAACIKNFSGIETNLSRLNYLNKFKLKVNKMYATKKIIWQDADSCLMEALNGGNSKFKI